MYGAMEKLPFREVVRTDLLEYETTPLPVEPDGSIVLPVKPWEIVTMFIKHWAG
jgi:hypothetical protein